MSAPPNLPLTPEEYLEMDRGAEVPSEYYGGEIVSMAVGTADHSTIITNFIRAADGSATRRGCRLHAGHLRLSIPPGSIYCYPDVMATGVQGSG